MDEAAKTAPVSREDLEAAEAWMGGHFFKKKGQPGAIGDEWKQIVAACKGFGLKDKESWRDWVYERWNAKGEAQASVVRMLKVAGILKGGSPADLPGDLKALHAWLKTHPKSSLADAQAQVGPKVSEADFEKLESLGMAYQPLVGKWEAM